MIGMGVFPNQRDLALSMSRKCLPERRCAPTLGAVPDRMLICCSELFERLWTDFSEAAAMTGTECRALTQGSRICRSTMGFWAFQEPIGFLEYLWVIWNLSSENLPPRPLVMPRFGALPLHLAHPTQRMAPARSRPCPDARFHAPRSVTRAFSGSARYGMSASFSREGAAGSRRAVPAARGHSGVPLSGSREAAGKRIMGRRCRCTARKPSARRSAQAPLP